MKRFILFFLNAKLNQSQERVAKKAKEVEQPVRAAPPDCRRDN
ncbi:MULTISPECIES: hypothetical protein [Hyphomonas]|jgi:hypothetical protein|nr:hypothetical protein [Hyphomonas jannaschiana]